MEIISQIWSGIFNVMNSVSVLGLTWWNLMLGFTLVSCGAFAFKKIFLGGDK